MNSKLMKFNKDLVRIKSKMEKLKGYGIDTTTYEKSVKSIEESIITETNVEEHISNVAVLKRMKVEPAYDQALNDLDNIEKNLDEYDNLLFIKSTIEDITNSNLNNIDEKKLYEYKAKILKCINDLNNFEVYDYKTVTDLLSDVYTCAYKIIKYELIINGKSDVFNYIKNTDKGVEFINELVKKEISELNANKFDYYNIENINDFVKTLNSNDSNAYANENLIFLIAFKNKDLRKIYEDEFDVVKNTVREESNKIVDIKEASGKLKAKAKEIKWEKIKYIGFTAWFSLLLISGIYSDDMAANELKSSCTVSGYETTVESYDTFSNKIDNEVIYSTMDENDVKITVYGEVDKNGNRTYKSYELEEAKLDDIRDYTSFNSSNDETDIVKYDEGTQITDESYVEVNKALSVNKDITSEILDQDEFADKYKSKTSLYHFFKIISASFIGISLSNLIMIFFDKNKRHKYLNEEINKNNEEFEIHKNSYEIASDKYELLKKKKKAGTGYPVYEDYENYYEIMAKKLVKKK